MDQQNTKVDNVEVGEHDAPSSSVRIRDNLPANVPGQSVLVRFDQIPRDAGGETVRPGHDPVTQIVDMAGHSPPPRSQQSRTSVRGDRSQVLDPRVLGVRPEAVLLVVC